MTLILNIQSLVANQKESSQLTRYFATTTPQNSRQSVRQFARGLPQGTGQRSRQRDELQRSYSESGEANKEPLCVELIALPSYSD